MNATELIANANANCVLDKCSSVISANGEPAISGKKPKNEPADQQHEAERARQAQHAAIRVTDVLRNAR